MHRTSDPAGAHQATGRRVISLLAVHRRRIAVLNIAVLVSSAAGLGIPLLTKMVFDKALFPSSGSARIGLLCLLAGGMVAFGVISGAAGITSSYIANDIGQRAMRDLRNKLYEHLQQMSLRFFTATRTGEIQSRLANDIGGLQLAVTNTFSIFFSDVAVALTAIIAMVFLSWQLTLVSLALIPLFIYMCRRIGRMRRAIAMATQEVLADMSVVAEETLSVSGILLSKIHGRGHIERYRAGSERLARLRVREQMVGRVFMGFTSTFLILTPALIYVAAGLFSNGGSSVELSAGTLVAFTAIQTRLFFPLREMLTMWLEIQASMALFARVFEYLDLPLEIVDARDAVPLTRQECAGAVTFRDVRFRYDEPTPDDAPSPRAWTLSDVSFEVAPGQTAAIVGPSGAGKTTISYLIPRLYDPVAGAIEIDGRDTRAITLSSLSDVIGMVTQDTHLFHGTVHENLLYARPGATREEIEAAARAGVIHERIMEMPDGYDTLVGERGYRMSGGEKQRLAIARALLKDPRILILDEATSSLDTRNERIVQAALRPLMAGRTTIAIAHRLSTIVAADVIFVLDQGRLVQQGTHQELLDESGLYRELYHDQFHDGRLEARCADGVVLSTGEVFQAA
jgi:ATP-binding cassette subfamily B protein